MVRGAPTAAHNSKTKGHPCHQHVIGFPGASGLQLPRLHTGEQQRVYSKQWVSGVDVLPE